MTAIDMILNARECTNMEAAVTALATSVYAVGSHRSAQMKKQSLLPKATPCICRSPSRASNRACKPVSSSTSRSHACVRSSPASTKPVGIFQTPCKTVHMPGPSLWVAMLLLHWHGENMHSQWSCSLKWHIGGVWSNIGKRILR